MTIVICKRCGKSFEKTNNNIRRTNNNNFCSRTCAAIYNNKMSPKRTLSKTITLKEYYDKGDYRTYKTRINEHARRVFNKRFPSHEGCLHCNYKRYFEICHIKPISEYPLDTTLFLVNDILNLIPLCPTCHWELDHGFITREEALKIVNAYSLNPLVLV